MSSVRAPRPLSPTIVGGPPSTLRAVASTPARRVRSSTMRAVSATPMPCAEMVGWRISDLSSSMYSGTRARTYASNSAKPVTRCRLSLGRDGRRSSPALAKLASRRDRRHLDPAFLAEVMDDAVGVLERLAPIDLRARDHVEAVTAVHRKRRPRAVRGARDTDREEETAEREQDDEREDKDDPKSTHIRRGLPYVMNGTGGNS